MKLILKASIFLLSANFLSQCVSQEKRKNEIVYLNRVEVCNELKDGTCPAQIHEGIHISKDFFACAKFSETKEKGSVQFFLESTHMSEKLAESQNYTSDKPLICHQFSFPEDKMPKMGEWYRIRLVGHGIDLYGQHTPLFQILPMAQMERAKICLTLDKDHNKCSVALDGIPSTTKELYVTLIFDKESPSESVSIQIQKGTFLDDENKTFLNTQTKAIESKEITIHLNLESHLEKGKYNLVFEYHDSNGNSYKSLSSKYFHVE